MVLRAKDGKPLWNGVTEVSAEEDACEVLGSFGRKEALDICREELERAAGPEETAHWTEVKAILLAERDEDDEDAMEAEIPHPDQLVLRLS